MVKAEVAAAFVVVKAKLALELFVVELDHPPQSREARELLGLGRGGQVADPVVAGMLVPFGPLHDQPFLAWFFVQLVDRVGGDHSQEREPRHELTAVDVTERDRLEGVGVQAGDELADRPRLGVGPQDARRPATRPGLARRHREHGAGRVDVEFRADAQDVVDPVTVQAGAELGVVAVSLIAEDRGAADLPARRPGDEVSTERRLGLELDVRGDLRLTPADRVRASLLGQVEPEPQRDRALGTDGVQRHRDLAVADLPQRP